MKAAEKSRRARNYEPAQPITLVKIAGSADPHDWYSGFASALSQVWRLHHDGQTIRHIMAATGIRFKHFEDAGVDEFDLSAVREALSGR